MANRTINLNCGFFIWCQECRIVGFFFFSCQVLVSNNALAQSFKTQRCESFESLEKLFSSCLFVVLQVIQQRRFLPSFLKDDLAADQMKMLQCDLVNSPAWLQEGGERGGGPGHVWAARTHWSSILPGLFLRPYNLPKSFSNQDCHPFHRFRAAGGEGPRSILLITICLIGS